MKAIRLKYIKKVNIEKSKDSNTVKSKEEGPVKETENKRPVKWHFRNKVTKVYLGGRDQLV